MLWAFLKNVSNICLYITHMFIFCITNLLMKINLFFLIFLRTVREVWANSDYYTTNPCRKPCNLPLSCRDHVTYLYIPVRYRCSLDDTPSNQKVFTIISHQFEDLETGKPVFTVQEISEGVNHPDRQYSDNL